MSKQILLERQARQKLVEGINVITDAIKITLGPKGRNVVIERKNKGEPDIINDGATIARNISLKDPFQDQGVQLIRSIALKTESSAGDGTSTSAVLAQAIILQGIEAIEKGHNPILFEKGIQAATDQIVQYLKEMAIKVTSVDLPKLATLCAQDETIGQTVGEVLNKYGKDAVITVEDSAIPGISYEMVQGYQFERGWISPYMINKPDRLETVIEDAYILVLDRKLVMVTDLIPVLEMFTKETGKKELVIIAEAIEGDALATLVLNKVQGRFLGLGIMAPSFGSTRREALEDIAIATGATVIAAEAGMKMEDVKLSMLGRAKKVVARRETTEIIGGYGDEEEIKERVERLKFQLETPDATDFWKKQLKDRIGKLTGTAAIMKIGYDSEAETTYKKLKIEDTIAATKAALEEGILPGGGYAYLAVKDKLVNDSDDKDIFAGYQAVVKALEAPILQLAQNAGLDGREVIKKVKQTGKGCDMLTGEYVNIIEKGIIDPLKVERLALQNATSVAKTLLTAGAVIVDEPPKEK